ncbi:unnamed protein product [Linum tenue]|uniref:F-box domain-containing protein n=1 Tax=Linum tenue TaxID=586396 RepID=A0AAV0IQ94_9ROSI|nr:unnamed protein product [Linum tenue]
MVSIRGILRNMLACRDNQLEVEEMEGKPRRHLLEEDILMEIFSWLPVKTLFQLKSVCRNWNAIIKSPILASMHLTNYTNKSSSARDAFKTLIVYEDQQGLGNKKVIQVSPSNGDVKKVRYMEVQMQVISGPCNGIFLLGNPQDSYDPALTLWNPATGQFREVAEPPPICPSREGKFSLHSYGFGMDKGDVKIVLIRHFSPSPHRYPGRTLIPAGYSSPECPSQVMVYSLETDTWRVLEDFKHQVEIVRFVECYRYWNGFIFWLCASPIAALGFDLRNEAFVVIEDPVHVSIDGYLSAPVKQLAMYKGSLALFINQWSSGYDVWLLDEDWCWVRWSTIGPFVPDDMFVVGYWGVDQDRLVLLVPDLVYGNDLLLFDPVSKATEVVLSRCLFPSGVFVYEETLASL